MTGQKRSDYASFLLRLRKTEQFGTSHWVVSLVRIQTGESTNLSLDALIQLLREEFSAPPEDCPMGEECARRQPPGATPNSGQA